MFRRIIAPPRAQKEFYLGRLTLQQEGTTILPTIRSLTHNTVSETRRPKTQSYAAVSGSQTDPCHIHTPQFCVYRWIAVSVDSVSVAQKKKFGKLNK